MHNGQVFSFGHSDSGQFGLRNNVIYKKRIMTPTVIPNLNPIKSIGTRDHFSMVVNIINNIYAWGFGEFSVLENNKDEDETSPFQILNLNGLREKDVVRISCGSSHALFLGV
ncbi:regulator of chromosome condensation 1/beta-lactamase-inhibitor protein II [Glomus cerebriforme]|uniref:Regulator of chromosome condensation 1/beta-lactamase-inhibitor protein II n=1 Tax=Glomus cerebriforme TaxID=658196 RepID=A0A397TM38_9GLOM|nr:regulator of chromosome condensation 1/beta-lactamase-inhibitor protein II [Glomus cerebriforme]